MLQTGLGLLALADLSIDDKILEAMKDKGKVVVIGTRYSGLTKTRERILGKLEAGKLGFNASNIVESQISTSVLDSLPDVVKTLNVAQTQQKHVVFINDYWKSITENPPDWLRDEPYSHHLPDLEGFFATHENDVIPLIVGEEDAKGIVRSYFKEEHTIPEGNLRGFPEEALLRLAQFGDKDEVTYIPKVIIETLQGWTGKNGTVMEKLRHPRPFLSSLLPSKEEREIEQAFKDLENDLKSKLEANIEVLAILGIASPLVSTLTNSESAVGNIFSLLGMKTLAGSAFFGLPVTLGFLTASLIGLVVAKKSGVSESQKKEFEKLGKAFTKAQDFWHNGLTKTQKDLFCYKLDKEYRRPLGTSEKDLEEHYMTYQERETKWNELRDKIKSAADDLSPGQQTLVQTLLKPFSERLQAVEVGLELVKKELDAEREDRVRGDLAIEEKLESEFDERLKLEEKVRTLEKERGWRDPSEQTVSWRRIQNPSALESSELMALVNLQFYSLKGSEVIPEFVPFGNAEELEHKLSSSQRLFVTGRSGSGKSRLIFEAIQRRKTRAGCLWIIDVGAQATEGTIQDLIDEMRQEKDTGSPVLLWDNFPRGLRDNQDPETCKSVLRLLAGLGGRNIEIIFSLDPHQYDTMSDLPMGIHLIEVVDIGYTIRDLSRLLESIGRAQLGEQEYNSRIGQQRDSIAEVLFQRLNRPLYVAHFCQALRNDPNGTALSIARSLVAKDFAETIRVEFRQLETMDWELRERDVHRSNMDLLYSIKLSKMLGVSTSMGSVESLQERIFGTAPLSPLHRLRGFVEVQSGSYLLHDSYSDILEYSQDSAKEVIDALGRLGFWRLLDPLATEDKATIAYDASGFQGFGRFLGENYVFLTPIELGKILTKVPQLVTMGLGETFDKISRSYRRDLMDFLVSGPHGTVLHYLGEGAGHSYSRFPDGEKDQSIGFASQIESFGQGLGEGVGTSFHQLPDADKNRLIELASQSKDFAFGFGTLGLNFGRLTEPDKDKVLKLAGRNPMFAEMLGRNIHLSNLASEDGKRVLELAKVSDVFFRNFITHNHENFHELSAQDIARLRSILARLLSSRSREQLTFELGMEIGGGWNQFPYQLRDMLLEFAKLNMRFATALGFHLRFGDNFAELSDSDKDQVIALVSMMDRRESHGKDMLGQHIGMDFHQLSDRYKDRILELARVNDRFTSGLGLQIMWNFDKLTDQYKDMALALAEENPRFADVFCGEVDHWFGQVSDEYRDKVFELAKRDHKFGRTFSKGMGGIFGGLADEYKDRVFELGRLNREVAQELGNELGKSFSSMQDSDRDRVLDFAKSSRAFAKGFGQCPAVTSSRTESTVYIMVNASDGLGLGFQELSDRYKDEIIELAKSVEVFRSGFCSNTTNLENLVSRRLLQEAYAAKLRELCKKVDAQKFSRR